VSAEGSLTVRDLLGARVIPDGRILAGAVGLDAEVLDVRPATDMGSVDAARRGDLLVFTGHAPHLVEMALQRASAARVCAIILVRPSADADQPPSATTLSFADRLGVPLLHTAATDPLLVADTLRTAVHRPDLTETRLLSTVLERLREEPLSPNRVLTVLEDELGVTAALATPDGSVIAGRIPVRIPESVLTGSSTGQTLRLTEATCAAVPVESDQSGHVRLWLMACIASGGKQWVECVLRVSQVVSWALATWLSTERLEAERSAHSLNSLLADLRASGDAVQPRVVQNALTAGWRLDGWHTGVHISRSAADGPGKQAPLVPALTERLRAALERQGLHGSLVEGNDSWSFWVTEDTEPTVASSRELSERVNQALTALIDVQPLVGGVGRPHGGASGVGKTLDEASEAASMADLSAGRSRALHIDELGMLRILSMATGTSGFTEHATRLLAPLAVADDGQLLRTLAVYLESESSTSSTATQLGVHRNTVAQRISRAEQLLGVNLLHPDERLAIQLACRAARVRLAPRGKCDS
jgi:PucR family transcriptional regulator, purine catabolism regulatory protein